MPDGTLTVFTKDSLFKPIPSGRESVASITDRTARSIVLAEHTARDEKTLRLKNQRMAYEETIVLPIARKKKARKLS